MSSIEVLQANEHLAPKNRPIISKVSGKNPVHKKKGHPLMAVFLTLILAVFFVLFGSPTAVPAMIYDKLVEVTDIQHADAVESEILVFQQVLKAGDIPDDVAQTLKENGILVGYLEDEKFVENHKSGKNSALSFNGRIIPYEDFVKEMHTDNRLYNIFISKLVAFSRAAYYYDASANAVFSKLGTSRNNYSEDVDFNTTMNNIVGSGSNINVNSVSIVEKTKEDEDGKTVTYKEYVQNGETLNSALGAASFVEGVRSKNLASDSNLATMNAAGTLNVADTISKEQKSSLFFLAFMENVSKMKAGEGNGAKISEAMNFLYSTCDSKVVDVKTGEVITVTGSMVESPSLYPVLSGQKLDVGEVSNYSSDRTLKTVENQLGVSSVNTDSIRGAVTSVDSKIRGSVGRFLDDGSAVASSENLSTVIPIINESLVENSFSDYCGVSGGEMLVSGAVNVGKSLAQASGASGGDASAVKSYTKLNSSIVALDNASDRMNRSPFDITSKNTFLGSIVYNLAVSFRGNSLLKSFANVITGAFNGFTSKTFADDETDNYLNNFGDCETLGSVSAVGSASCSEIATFDTSTLDGIFEDAGFNKFVEENTFINSSGSREIKKDSKLAAYIKYNNERMTPLGITDGGILTSLEGEYSSIPFVSDIVSLVRTLVSSDENTKRIASGAAFVNSSDNPDWQTYKYAQRYVSLARATNVLRMYSSDATAYTNIKYFEGRENPVVAFLTEYYANQSSQRL